jgi:hypothetical protein
LTGDHLSVEKGHKQGVNMPLSNENAPDDAYEALDTITAQFFRSVRAHYTRDTAVEVMNALAPILGKGWQGRVMFNLLADKYTKITKLMITRDLTKNYMKINAIKEHRMLTGDGLTDSKMYIEKAEHQPLTFDIKLDYHRPGLDRDPAAYDRQIMESIKVFRNCGFHVEAI